MYTEAARTSDLREGEMRKVTVRGKELLLARVEGHFYAMEPLCPHLQADLSEGTLRGTLLECPLHGSEFDIRDGHVVRWTNLPVSVLFHDTRIHPPRPLKRYPVKIEGDRVLVAIG